MIYLDHNATTPPAPAVIAAMLPVLSSLWANTSSQHGPGQEAKRVLSTARATVARVLGCKPVEVIFTSGATEANHMAVRGLLAASAPERRRVVFSSVEHAGHLRLARALAAVGVQVDWMPVLAAGTLDLVAAARLMGPDVALVSLMAANNETGVLMPVAEVAALAHAAGALLHVDATQLIGKLPFNFADCGADAVSLSAHKFQGPKGVGALLLRQGVPFVPQTLGSQERGRRGGTENLPGIVGMAAALDLLGDVSLEAERQRTLRDDFESGLTRALPETHIWCQHVPRLPGTSYLRFGQLSVDVVLQRLDRLGVAASSGAACSSGGSQPSHVLTAMGVPAEDALAAVRFSLGRTTTLDDVTTLLKTLPPLLAPLLREITLAPTLVTSCTSLPPEGAPLAWGGPAQRGSLLLKADFLNPYLPHQEPLMKLMIRKDSKGVLTGYVPKKDLEEPIIAMANPDMWGGLVTLANGWQFDLPAMPLDTPLPITVEARRMALTEDAGD